MVKIQVPKQRTARKNTYMMPRKKHEQERKNMRFHAEKTFKSMMIFATMTIAATALNAQSAFTVEVTQNINTQNSGAVIEVQEDNKSALIFGESPRPQSMMFFWIPKNNCAGKKLRISAMVKGENLSKNFIFGIQASKDGKPIWPAGTGASGTFGWRPFSFEVDFAKLGVESGAIRIGLQNTQGKVMFRDIKTEEVPAASN